MKAFFCEEVGGAAAGALIKKVAFFYIRWLAASLCFPCDETDAACRVYPCVHRRVA